MKICLSTKYQALCLLEIKKCIRFGSFPQGIYSIEATLQALECSFIPLLIDINQRFNCLQDRHILNTRLGINTIHSHAYMT